MAKKSTLIGEFKTFISRGSVMDLAVGIIIGTAFTAIVRSLVNDIVMPVIGLIIGGVDFTRLQIVLRKATESHPALAITYGSFIQAIINFILVALVVFFLIRSINKLRAKKEVQEAVEAKVEPVIPADIALLSEIRDLLKKKE